MRLVFNLIFLMTTANFMYYINGSFIKSRTWHEELVVSNSKSHTKILYPRFKVCRAPREKPEKVKTRSSQSILKTTEVTWAELLSIYSADSGGEIFNWNLYKKESSPKKMSRFQQLLSITRFQLVLVFVFVIFITVVPTVGGCGFKFYSLIWFVIFHPEMRRICRRLFITKEKISRRHMKLLKTGDILQQKRRPFRLPYALREYNEEEIPAELIVSEEDESEGEVSSDGFENLLIRTKSRNTGQSHSALAKNLVHLMATTEKELAGTDADAVEGYFKPPSSRNQESFLKNIRNKTKIFSKK